MVRGDGLRLAAKLERRALDMLFVLKGDDPTTEWRKKGKKPTGKFRSHGGRDQPLIFWNDAKAHTSGTPPGQQSIARLLRKSAPTPAVDASRTGASATVPMPAYAAGQQTWTSTAIVSLQKPSRLKPCSHSQKRTKQRRLNGTDTALAPAADSLPTGELAVMKNLDAEHKQLAALTDGHTMVLPSNNVVKPGLAVGLSGSFPSYCRMGGLVRASNANGVVMKHQCGMCGYFTHGALCCPNNVDTGSYRCYYCSKQVDSSQARLLDNTPVEFIIDISLNGSQKTMAPNNRSTDVATERQGWSKFFSAPTFIQGKKKNLLDREDAVSTSPPAK
ncbi:hypothetical protein IV203_038673 [Nitzschia inconspicua]|uniref:Uncharacterized protein n=1 Tax=Nitzschia inconspicua TaxID=303405 RepID=A0A9K3LPD5_9STRA|nr:hypothetical protein IV203_038673 [Nitzschia inconspicua]